jgi:hypothetical protein
MNLLAPAPTYALAGLKACLVGPWVAGANYVYASAQLDIINELDPAAVWWPVDCQQADRACEFGEAFGIDKNGQAYTQTISLALPGLAAGLRAGLQNFIGKPLLALCQDMRSQWWLLGQDAGLRLPSYAAKSGLGGGETLTSWLLTGRQDTAARQVALDGPISTVDYGFTPGTGNGGGGSLHTFPFTLA